MSQLSNASCISSKKSNRDAWSAKAYNTTASFVYSSAFTTPVLDLLNPQSGETIFDFGCGTGELTLKIQEAVGEDGFVAGVDSSENMINQAKINGLYPCFVGDIQDLELPSDILFPRYFDAVFSNATLHWCKRDPVGAIISAHRILRAGGRFAGEMGGFMNCIGVVGALYHAVKKRGKDAKALSPWYFPSVEDYRSKLTDAGFRVEQISLHPRFTPLKGSLVDWLKVFARNTFLASFDELDANEIMQEVEDMCAVDCRDERDNWALMYVRLRFLAIKE